MTKTILRLLLFSFIVCSYTRPDREYPIFQFPQNRIPRIDGDFSDWDMVPETYTIGLVELKNTRVGEGHALDPKDFNLKVKVGWVKGLNRLYFYIDAFDNYWDFKDAGMRQDIFELVVDADISGGPFIYEELSNKIKLQKNKGYFKTHGAAAQNYHVFTPSKNKDWAMLWGNTPWLKEFPYANSATKYHFQNGDSGRLQMEFYITPYDYASFNGPEYSAPSRLAENSLIGLSWSMLDYDGDSCKAFMNLSHDFEMIRNADYLCAFRLMPPEEKYKKSIDANWRFITEDREKRMIRFYDQSTGNITKWHWDFGDGTSSDEQNPLHRYEKGKEWIVVLRVEGPDGKSTRSKVWDVVTQ